MSHRIPQVESTLKRALAQVLSRDLSDPRVEGLVSITAVEVSPDMRHARIGVSVFPGQKQRTTVAALNHASGHIHRLLGKHMAMRTMPHLRFEVDEGIKKEAAVLEAIRRGVAVSGTEPADADAQDSPASEGAPTP